MGSEFTEDNLCVGTCKSGHFEIRGTKKQCVDECSGPSGPDVNGKCVPCTALGDTKFYDENEKKCIKECPKDARFYLESDKLCAKKCSSGYFKASGSFVCEKVPDPFGATHAVSFSNTIYKYLYPRATSYGEVRWNVPDA